MTTPDELLGLAPHEQDARSTRRHSSGTRCPPPPNSRRRRCIRSCIVMRRKRCRDRYSTSRRLSSSPTFTAPGVVLCLGCHRKKCRFERPVAERHKTGTDPVKPLDTCRCRRLRHIYQGFSNSVRLPTRTESSQRAPPKESRR